MFNTLTRMGASLSGAYEIERSLRFNQADSAKLSHLPSSAGNLRTWTFSCWFKRAKTGSDTEIFSPYRGGDGSNESQIKIGSDDKLWWYDSGGSANYIYLKTTRLFRDCSAWYHLVVAADTTQGTAANRGKIYINGVQLTEFDTEQYGDQNQDMGFMNNHNNYIGAYGYNSGGSSFFDGYLAEMHWVDGTQLTAESFGKTDASTGQWIPKKYAGAHGSKGWYLNFSDNSGTSAATLGADSSANSNNWTPTNFSVASGPGNDSVLDTPSNNYCTLDPLDKKDCIIVDGMLSTATTEGGGHQPGFSTFGLTSGKWYVEGGKITSNASTVCVWPKEHDEHSYTQDHAVHNNAGNQNAKGYGFNLNYGSATHTPDNTVTSYTSTSFTTWMLALDLDNGKIWWGVDGTWGNNGGTGDPAAGSNPAFSSGFAGEVWTVGSMTTTGHNISFNFGQQGFAYTPPTGFKPICTENLPATTIKKGSDHFNTILYTGNNTDDRNIGGLDFQPNLIWIKERSGTESHLLFNSVIGSSNFTNPNSTGQEGSDANALQSFRSDGFQIGTSSELNANSETYVAWNWKGGSTVTNDTGSIDSQVNANPSAGFSIVSYTGTGSDITIGHGLGVVPDAIIVKCRSDASTNWGVFHKSLGASYIVQLDVDNAQWQNSGVFNDELPTSSVFSVDGGSGMSGTLNRTYIAYCFASVAGYSKVGHYKGNGSASNGMFVHLGFKPAWLLIKRTDAAEDWWLYDSKRDTGNPHTQFLYANANTAEQTGTGDNIALDFVSSGVKLRTANVNWNADGGTYIYLAFAERPFKYSNAR